jgi:hypothetical protein
VHEQASDLGYGANSVYLLRRNSEQPVHLTATDASGLEARRFIALEVRVISTEKKALQPLCVSEHISRYAFPFYFKETDKSVYRFRNGTVNERVRLRQFGVALRGVPEDIELALRILLFFRREAFLKLRPVFHHLDG